MPCQRHGGGIAVGAADPPGPGQLIQNAATDDSGSPDQNCLANAKTLEGMLHCCGYRCGLHQEHRIAGGSGIGSGSQGVWEIAPAGDDRGTDAVGGHPGGNAGGRVKAVTSGNPFYFQAHSPQSVGHVVADCPCAP